MNMGRPKKEKPPTKKEMADVEKMLGSLSEIPLPTRKKMTMKHKVHNSDAIKKLLSEYLDSYILIGYDLSEDALVSLQDNDSVLKRRAVISLFNDVAQSMGSIGSGRGMNSDMDFDGDFDEDFDDDFDDL